MALAFYEEVLHFVLQVLHYLLQAAFRLFFIKNRVLPPFSRTKLLRMQQMPPSSVFSLSPSLL